MTNWTPDLTGRRGPIHRALTDAIGEAVADGSLAIDQRLPPQRELAYALGLSLGTVTRAYKDAERRGWVTGEVGRGTYVRSGGAGWPADSLWGPARDPNGPIGLVMNLPPAGIAAAALAETFCDLGSAGDLGALLDHQSTGRIAAHSASAAAWLGRIGVPATGDDVVLCNGAQHGILMALMATARPSDTVLAEALTYPPLKQMAHHFSLTLSGLEMDDAGIIPDALEAACRNTGARLLYCMPTLHSPTGATMPEPRRQEIAGIARKYDLTIIEDDVFGFLPEDRPPPLSTYVPERTILVTSVSKSLAPGLRIGIVHGPKDRLDAVRDAVQMSCWMPSPITAEITHRWIADGTADRVNRWLRGEMKARSRLAHDLLGEEGVGANGLSYHLWIALPPSWTEEAFRAAVDERGVRVASGETFLLKPGSPPQALRLALGYETDRDRLAKGLKIVAELLASDGARRPSIV